MKIRPFLEQDRETVIKLWQACGLTRPWNDPNKDIDRKLAVQPELFLVGEVNGQLVATVMAGYEGHRGWINYLGVAPEAQGRGYGAQLMMFAEQALLSVGCPKINLMVRNTNHGVVEFYRKLGYSVDEVVALGKRLIPDN